MLAAADEVVNPVQVVPTKRSKPKAAAEAVNQTAQVALMKKKPKKLFKNLIQLQDGSDQFYSGCAGYGCGAAFNFVSLLPDGRVDACRKFDSPLGNIFENSLLDIYESEHARHPRDWVISINFVTY